MNIMELHHECQKVVDYLKDNPTDISKLTIEQIRKYAAARTAILSGGDDYPFDGVRTEEIVSSQHVKEGLPVYIFKPNSLSIDPVIFVYVHGGGMTIGTRLSQDSSCKIISESAGCIIVNVEYRIAPEHKFPASIEDATTVVEWVKQNKVHFGGSEKSKVGLGGDSAGGGTITASVAHDVPMDFQVLLYPHVTTGRDYSLESFTKYKDGPLLTQQYIQWFEANYIPPGQEANPRLASILRDTFDHLPPAIVIIAEHDPLYDVYVKKLKEHNVPVEVHEFKGAIHAFYGKTLYCPTLCKDAYGKVTDFIKRIHQNQV